MSTKERMHASRNDGSMHARIPDDCQFSREKWPHENTDHAGRVMIMNEIFVVQHKQNTSFGETKHMNLRLDHSKTGKEKNFLRRSSFFLCYFFAWFNNSSKRTGEHFLTGETPPGRTHTPAPTHERRKGSFWKISGDPNLSPSPSVMHTGEQFGLSTKVRTKKKL